MDFLPHLERNGHRGTEDSPWVLLPSLMDGRVRAKLVIYMDRTNTLMLMLPKMTNQIINPLPLEMGKNLGRGRICVERKDGNPLQGCYHME